MQPLLPGQHVRFVAPLTTAEASERFTVVEVRGPRVLVRLADSHLSIPPTFVYLRHHLTTEPAP